MIPIAMLSDGRDNKIRGVFDDVKLNRNVFNLDKDDFELSWLETTHVSEISRASIVDKKQCIDDVFDRISFHSDSSIDLDLFCRA